MSVVDERILEWLRKPWPDKASPRWRCFVLWRLPPPSRRKRRTCPSRQRRRITPKSCMSPLIKASHTGWYRAVMHIGPWHPVSPHDTLPFKRSFGCKISRIRSASHWPVRISSFSASATEAIAARGRRSCRMCKFMSQPCGVRPIVTGRSHKAGSFCDRRAAATDYPRLPRSSVALFYHSSTLPQLFGQRECTLRRRLIA